MQNKNLQTILIGENLLGQKPLLFVGMKITCRLVIYEVVEIINSFTCKVKIIQVIHNKGGLGKKIR